MPLKVLLADDQIPWGEPYKDERVREEIVSQLGEILRKKGKDPDACYLEDKKWFQGLIDYLDPRFKLTLAREYDEAEEFVSEPKKFDVAVIDLSWTGDPSRKDRPRENIGLKLLDKLSKAGLPTIAFSQNFEKERALMSDVLALGALPLQKHYDDTGWHALASAIKYVTMESAVDPQRSELKPGELTFGEIRDNMSVAQIWKTIVAVSTVVTAITVGAYTLGTRQFFSEQLKEPDKSMQQTQ